MAEIPAGRYLELQNRGTTFIREAAGPAGAPTVVLLHGLGATGALNWFPAFAPLRERYNVVSIDHRGHGRGLKTRRPFRLEDCADDVAILIDELGLGSAILAGYSMGGPIAQLTWHRHPEVVRGMVFCATSYGFVRANMRSFPTLNVASTALRLTPMAVRRQIVPAAIRFNPRIRDRNSLVADELNHHDPAAFLEASSAVRRYDASEWIDEIDVPTASVITDLDQLVPARRQERLAERVHAEVFHVRGGHDACVVVPSRFNPALVAAVDSVTARSEPAARRG